MRPPSRSLRRMARIVGVLVVLWAMLAAASAMVGGAPAVDDATARAVVTVVSSRGSFCSGALIAPDIVMTAAHCLRPGADYRIVDDKSAPKPTLRPVRRFATHPGYVASAIDNRRATADVALLQLAIPLAATPLALGVPAPPLAAGRVFRVVGIGVSIPDEGRSGGTARAASLVATGRPGTLQIRLMDPATGNRRAGLGACTGDSGAPVFENQGGRDVVVGVVSWSTASGDAGDCGGLTGVTPLTLYRDWIERTAKAWGARLD